MMLSIQCAPLAFLVLLASLGCVCGDLTINQSGGDGFTYVYFISDTARNWHMAKNDCRVRGLQLASPANLEENDSLRNAISSRTNDVFWLGGSDLGSTGTWYWDATGAPFDYTNWYTGEPNLPGQEQCLELRGDNRLWNNAVCTNNKKYVCEGYLPSVQ